jgi:hypothetical protein
MFRLRHSQVRGKASCFAAAFLLALSVTGARSRARLGASYALSVLGYLEENRGLHGLLAILISLHGGTGAVPSLILGRHSGRPSNLPPCGVFSAHKLCLVIFYEVVQNLTA